MSLRRTFLCALVLVLVCWSTNAFAAGLFLPGHGVKPLGRGGAFVASGSGDLNSLWHNPANLATLEELTLTIDLSLISLDFEFQRAPRTMPNGEVVEFDRVRDEAPPKPDPQILIGGPLPFDGFTWSFGLYAPYLSGQTFPENGPQRYVLIDNDPSILLYLHAAVGWKISDNLRIGAGIQNMVADFVLVQTVSGYPGIFGDQEDEDLDILTKITLGSAFNLTGNFGVWFQVMPNIEAAFSLQLPTRIYDSEATMEARLPSHAAFDDAVLNGNTLQATMNLPLVLRLGLRYFNGTIDYELAAVYEGWSIFKEIEAVPNNITVDNVRGIGSIRVSALTIPMNWQDTFSIRNGFQYTFNESFALRAGYTFETEAIPDEYYSVFLADASKNIFTLGATYKGESWAIDAAGAYYLMPDRVITNSKFHQINPTDPDNNVTTIVGNGEYKQSFLIFGLGFTKKF